MKNALFGEYINESSFQSDSYINTVSLIFFWLNVAVAGSALVAMIVMCFRKCSATSTEKLFLAGFYIMMMASFYKTAADYPFTCTMNFRYITPTVIVETVFIGLSLHKTYSNRILDRTITMLYTIGALMFTLCSGIVYLTLY